LQDLFARRAVESLPTLGDGVLVALTSAKGDGQRGNADLLGTLLDKATKDGRFAHFVENYPYGGF
jgi:hypothetical protein